MSTVVIETPRLILRELTRDDLDDLAALFADPKVMRYIGDGATKSRQESAQLLERLLVNNDRSWSAELLERLPQLRRSFERDAHFGPLATICKDDGRFIGRCGLLAWDLDGRKEVEVGYMIARSHWNRGLATEAARAIRDYGFDTLDFDRLISLIHRDNAASQRVAVKNGMTFERETMVGTTPVVVYAIGRADRDAAAAAAAPAAGR